jgi:hypothetical protein
MIYYSTGYESSNQKDKKLVAGRCGDVCWWTTSCDLFRERMYPDGYHVHTYPSGSRYEGEWRGGKKEGKGTYKYAGGGEYIGNFFDDKRHGQGMYKYPDGDVYEGEFRFGRREGKGTYRYFKGEKYEGEWYADKMHGRGKYTYVTGKIFDGIWRDDRPHGQGKLIDGDRRFDMVYDNGVVTMQRPEGGEKQASKDEPLFSLGWWQAAFACQPVTGCMDDRGGQSKN